jgi:hypothetical protein
LNSGSRLVTWIDNCNLSQDGGASIKVGRKGPEAILRGQQPGDRSRQFTPIPLSLFCLAVEEGQIALEFPPGWIIAVAERHLQEWPQS